MRKLFLAFLLATSAIICVVPSQELLAGHNKEHRQPVFGAFYSLATGTEIPEFGSVPFTSVAVKTDGLDILDGNILIKDTGKYLVIRGIAIDTEATFQLSLNDQFIEGTLQPEGPNLYHPFSTIIDVSEKDSVLSIVAVTAASLSARDTGVTTAFITILKVGD